GQDQTFLSNTSQVFFGVNETSTADYVSARLGEKTIVVDSGGRGSSVSHQSSQGSHSRASRTTSSNPNSNWQQQSRNLLQPGEVIALPPTTAITFTPGVLPVCTTLLRYYEEKTLGRKSGWIRRTCAASSMLLSSAALLMLSVAIAALLHRAVQDAHRPPML